MAASQDQVPDRWGEIASAYERSFEGLTAQFAADLLGRLHLQPGERLLDVAAGTGTCSLLAARSGAHVIATDFAAGMVARLRDRAAAERLGHVAAAVMDGQALALPDGAVDAAVSVLGLIFFPDISKGMAELRRVLKPGGRAAIVCWSDPANLQLMTSVVKAVQEVVPGFQLPSGRPVWARLAGSAGLTDQMRAAGFQRVEVTTCTGSLRVTSPETFWNDFASAAPPLAFLFKQLGPERSAAVGRVYMEALRATSHDGTPSLVAEACIGIGWA